MISDDTLTLYFYDDGLTAAEKQEIAAALDADVQLASRYAHLCRQLEAWREPAPQPVPDHLLHRWHDSIDRVALEEAALPRKPRKSFHLLSFTWGGAVATVLALGIGTYFSTVDSVDHEGASITASHQTSPTVPVAFTRGLEAHLRDSQAGLISLSAATDAGKRELLQRIVEQNRMFERSADVNHAPDVARLLRAFEPILLRLADNEIAPADSQVLRAQLSFELEVMLTKLARGASHHESTI